MQVNNHHHKSPKSHVSLDPVRSSESDDTLIAIQHSDRVTTVHCPSVPYTVGLPDALFPSEDKVMTKLASNGDSPLHTVGLFDFKEINILLDSGANVSCVNSELLNARQWEKTEVLLTTAGKTSLKVLGKTAITFTVAHKLFTHTVYVVKDLNCSMLLGNDFLKSYGVILNYEDNTITISHSGVKTHFPMHINSKFTTDLDTLRVESISLKSKPPWAIQEIKDGEFTQCSTPATKLSSHGSGEVTDLAGTKIDINPNLSPEQLVAAKSLLFSYRDVFAKDDTDLGVAKMPPYKLTLKSDEPISLPPFKLGPRERDELDRQIDALETAGVVEKCQSPFSAPTFLVKKPGGKFRVVHCYKKINENIVSDKFPLPRIDTILDTLESAQYYCQMDITQAFFQQPIAPECKDYTAFITHKGLYRYTRLPQGMKTSPNAFQRSMNTVFAGLLYHGVVLYLDDLVSYGENFDLQLSNLEETLRRLRDAGLKIKTSKCHFFYQKIKFLGFEVQPEGIHPSEDNVKAILDFPKPKTVKDVRSFLGMTSFYRKFVPGYSNVSHPLTELTKKDQVSSKSLTWEEPQENAFQSLKQALANPPLLAHFKDNLETIVMADASKIGVGGLISQFQEDGSLRPVAYVSRTLRNVESRWSVSELELLSVVYTVNHFRPMLLGRHFTIYNDHACLQYYKNIKNLSSRLNRLALKLVDYSFTIKHKPGAAMRVPDALSRYPVDDGTEDDVVSEELQINLISQVNINKLQIEDKHLTDIRTALLDPDAVSAKDRRTSRKYVLQDDILYYKDYNSGSSKLLLAIPVCLVNNILTAYHDSLTAGAHSGIAKTYQKIAMRYHWPNMARDIRNYVRSCNACQLRKGDKRGQAGKLQPIKLPGTTPFLKCQIDYVGPLPKSNGNQYILVAMDMTTRYAVTKATANADSKTTAKFILETIIPRFGCVKEIQSDRGSHFTAEVLKQLFEALGISHQKSSAYHPQSQGLTERYNGTLLNMLHFYANESHSDWSKYVEMVTFVYNASVQESTTYSPFFLLHGYHPLFPADLAILPRVPDHDVLEAVTKIQEIRKTVPQLLAKAQDKQKVHYDVTRHIREFKPGEKVVITTPFTGKQGTRKLAATYKGPFEVVRKVSDLCYEIALEKCGKWTTDIVNINRMKTYHERD